MSVTLLKTTCAALLAAILGFGALAPAEAGPRDDRGRWEQRHDGHRGDRDRRHHDRRDWAPPGHRKAHGKGHDKHRHEARDHDRRRYEAPARRWQPPPREVRHGWQQPHPREAFHRMSREERYQIQRRLARQGYYNGPIDGAWGPGTWNGMNSWANSGNGYNMSSTEATLMLLQALLR